MSGRRSYSERRALIEADRERLRADALQHERDLFTLKLKEIDAQQKTAIVMIRELRTEVVRLGRMLVETMLSQHDLPEARNHADAIIRDFALHKGGKTDVR